MYNVGSIVRFQEGTTGFILHGDKPFKVVEVGETLTLELENGQRMWAYPHELTLLVAVAAMALTESSSWWSNLSMPAMPDVSSWVQPGVELAIDIASSLPKHAESAATAVISTTGDAAASVSDALGSCASAVGDTIGSCAEAAGDILGSIDL